MKAARSIRAPKVSAHAVRTWSDERRGTRGGSGCRPPSSGSGRPGCEARNGIAAVAIESRRVEPADPAAERLLRAVPQAYRPIAGGVCLGGSHGIGSTRGKRTGVRRPCRQAVDCAAIRLSCDRVETSRRFFSVSLGPAASIMAVKSTDFLLCAQHRIGALDLGACAPVERRAGSPPQDMPSAPSRLDAPSARSKSRAVTLTCWIGWPAGPPARAEASDRSGSRNEPPPSAKPCATSPSAPASIARRPEGIRCRGRAVRCQADLLRPTWEKISSSSPRALGCIRIVKISPY